MPVDLSNPFFAPLAKTGGPLAGGPLSGGNGIFSIGGGLDGGASFMDLIFAQLTATGDGTQGDANSPGQPASPLGLFLHRIAAQVAAKNAAADASVQSEPLPEAFQALTDNLTPEQLVAQNADDAAALQDSQTATSDTPAAAASDTPASPFFSGKALPVRLAAVISHLLAGLPQEQRATVLDSLPSGILKQAIIKRLDASAQSADDFAAQSAQTMEDTAAFTADNTALTTGADDSAAAPALIATGLTPEKLTALIDAIKKKIAGVDDGQTNPLAGIVQILPLPLDKTNVIFVPRNGAPLLPLIGKPGQQGSFKDAAAGSQAPDAPGIDGQQVGGQNGGAQGSKALPVVTADINADLASKLNALTVGGDSAAVNGGDQSGNAGSSFGQILQILEQGKLSRTPGLPQSLPDSGKPAADPGRSVAPSLSTFPGDFANAAGGMGFNSLFASQIYPDGLDWSDSQSSSGAATGVQSMTLNGPAMMTSLVGNAAHAAYPHPATQMVATSIMKAAADGQSKNITVKLDPPELGRLQISLNFSGKDDKALKTHILIEKPETYLMLQRDQHVLQRTLNNLGLDAGGSSLSFELASGGNQFSGQQDGGGSRNSGGGNAGSDAQDGIGMNIAETTIDWSIDPLSGHTQYSIWA